MSVEPEVADGVDEIAESRTEGLLDSHGGDEQDGPDGGYGRQLSPRTRFNGLSGLYPKGTTILR